MNIRNKIYLDRFWGPEKYIPVEEDKIHYMQSLNNIVLKE